MSHENFLIQRARANGSSYISAEAERRRAEREKWKNDFQRCSEALEAINARERLFEVTEILGVGKIDDKPGNDYSPPHVLLGSPSGIRFSARHYDSSLSDGVHYEISTGIGVTVDTAINGNAFFYTYAQSKSGLKSDCDKESYEEKLDKFAIDVGNPAEARNVFQNQLVYILNKYFPRRMQKIAETGQASGPAPDFTIREELIIKSLWHKAYKKIHLTTYSVDFGQHIH